MARQTWKTRSAFLFAAIGSAVGLGNLWRFPYLTYEYGGGAFLIPYLLALFIIGIPLLLLEFGIGQKMQKGAAAAFASIHKKFKGLGYAAVAAGAIIMIYYVPVMAWSLLFLIKSFSPTLPWAGAAKDYFFGDILQISDGIGTLGGINWPLFFALAVVWLAIYFIVRKGTDSVGKVVMWSVPLPIILLFILLIRGVTLEGAAGGILAYLSPDLSALADPQIWVAATSQIFFTLSIAFGVMIAYASYNKKKENIFGNGFTTALVNSGISLLSGFVVFAVLGFMAFQNSVPVSDVVTSGPGLAFVVFPEALAMIPWWAPFFAILFFITLLTLGIDSAFSLVEAVITTVKDEKSKWSKANIAKVVCGAGFLLGLLFITGAGLYYLDVIDHFVTNITMIIVGILQCILVGWIYGPEKLRKYINGTSEKGKLGVWWDISIKYITPLVLIVLLVLQFMTEFTENYGGYPDWAIGIGWLAVIIPALLIIIPAVRTTSSEA